MAAPAPDHVAAVRGFNRFYTNVIGVLEEGLSRTSYSLTEARVLYELAQQDRLDVVELRRRLVLDPGYLTRILGRLADQGLLVRERSEADARRQVVSLTAKGRAEQKVLDERADDDVRALLGDLAAVEHAGLVGAMDAIRGLLGPAAAGGSPELRLRDLRPGDLGWVVARNGALYAQEYGWDQTYEALVASIVAEFGAHHDPERERGWVAELDGTPVGAVFCVSAHSAAPGTPAGAHSATPGTPAGAHSAAPGTPAEGPGEDTAKLRLLLVEPSARGHGVGTALVDACLEFARRVGYRRMVLWTNDVLTAARRIYQRAGFELIEKESHRSFGKDLVGETWARDL
ncbi:MAG TPA: helix-turn-helix domain-containing GNAT family N-acetyltransferase [Streptosporangiales bacterium]